MPLQAPWRQGRITTQYMKYSGFSSPSKVSLAPKISLNMLPYTEVALLQRLLPVTMSHTLERIPGYTLRFTEMSEWIRFRVLVQLVLYDCTLRCFSAQRRVMNRKRPQLPGIDKSNVCTWLAHADTVSLLSPPLSSASHYPATGTGLQNYPHNYRLWDKLQGWASPPSQLGHPNGPPCLVSTPAGRPKKASIKRVEQDSFINGPPGLGNYLDNKCCFPFPPSILPQ